MRILATVAATALALISLQVPSPAQADEVTVTPILSGSYAGSDPVGVAIDPSGGRWIKSNDALRFFPAGSTDATRVITGANAAIGFTGGVAVDAQGWIYVPSPTGIRIFEPWANGNWTPGRIITGANTGLASVSGVDVDAEGFIYVTDTSSDSVLTFAPSAVGNAFPIARISGGRTQLVDPADVRRSGDLIWVTSNSNAVVAFAPGDHGDVGPRRIIGGYRTLLASPAGIDVDSSGHLYVANGSSTDHLLVFAPTANGNAVPARVVTVAGRTSGPNEIAVDARRLVHLSNINASTSDTLAALRTTTPSAPRSVRVAGTATAATRTLSWLKPASDGFAAVTNYEVLVRAGSVQKYRKVVGPAVLSVKLSKSVIGPGTRTASVRSRNVNGWSPWTTVTFSVR